MGYPIAGWFRRENPNLEMDDDWGQPYFRKPPFRVGMVGKTRDNWIFKWLSCFLSPTTRVDQGNILRASWKGLFVNQLTSGGPHHPVGMVGITLRQNIVVSIGICRGFHWDWRFDSGIFMHDQTQSSHDSLRRDQEVYRDSLLYQS